MARYWTVSCFSAPFRVTDYFGSGQESVEEGHAAGWKVFFLSLAPLFSDFGPGLEVVVEGGVLSEEDVMSTGCWSWTGRERGTFVFCLLVWLLTWFDRTD